MFGFITKFKQEVYEGFESVKQRLVTLEAKVDALFEHNKVVAEADAQKVEAVVEAPAQEAEKVADAVKNT